MLRVLTSFPGRSESLVAVVNGLFGDTFEDRDSRWSTPMTIRAGDTVLPFDRHALLDSLSTVDVGQRICVLVHGLMSTESIWGFANDPSTTYGTLLADDHDVTVLSVRYNTGRHISTNGRELAHLLNHLVSAWPVRVREVNLIGHSMGGLVVRSACSLRVPPASPRSVAPDRAALDQQGASSRTDRCAEHWSRSRGCRQLRQRGLVGAAHSRHTTRRARARPTQRGHQGPPLRRDRRRGLARVGSRRSSTHLPPPAGPPPSSRLSRDRRHRHHRP